MPEITPDDRAKRVVDSDGEEIGLVAEVRDGTAYVDPDPDIPGSLKSRLGWGPSDREQYPLRNDAVAEVTDEEVRLTNEY